MNSDLEKKATQKARTVDPTVLPFSTSADKWQTWIGKEGQWIFIEKEAAANVAAALGMTYEAAFNFIGQQMLAWLSKSENQAKFKPRTVWKIEFGERKDAPVNFGAFANQCFVFTPRKI